MGCYFLVFIFFRYDYTIEFSWTALDSRWGVDPV
jgi:hypothetical protein